MCILVLFSCHLLCVGVCVCFSFFHVICWVCACILVFFHVICYVWVWVCVCSFFLM